jgi:lysozyme
MNVLDLIRKNEGLQLTPYKCPTGHWSIGYGHNLEARGEKVPESITLEKAESFLKTDLQECQVNCGLRIPDFKGYDEVRQAVLLDMCYNMGIEGLCQFHHMLSAMHVRHWIDAAAELLDSPYASQVGKRAKCNARMLIDGQWPKE